MNKTITIKVEGNAITIDTDGYATAAIPYSQENLEAAVIIVRTQLKELVKDPQPTIDPVTCEGCDRPAVPGDEYCRVCRVEADKEMALDNASEATGGSYPRSGSEEATPRDDEGSASSARVPGRTLGAHTRTTKEHLHPQDLNILDAIVSTASWDETDPLARVSKAQTLAILRARGESDLIVPTAERGFMSMDPRDNRGLWLTLKGWDEFRPLLAANDRLAHPDKDWARA